MIEEKFGKMTVTRGKKHTFLGMGIDFNDDGRTSILMKGYLVEAIDDFDGDIIKFAATPLLLSDDESLPLDFLLFWLIFHPQIQPSILMEPISVFVQYSWNPSFE